MPVYKTAPVPVQQFAYLEADLKAVERALKRTLSKLKPPSRLADQRIKTHYENKCRPLTAALLAVRAAIDSSTLAL